MLPVHVEVSVIERAAKMLDWTTHNLLIARFTHTLLLAVLNIIVGCTARKESIRKLLLGLFLGLLYYLG